MANLNELRKYLTHTFSTGVYTGKDYKTFQTKYINYFRSLCKLHGWELVNVGRNHYCFTAFIRNEENKYIYLSISDVRYFNNEWYYHILIRTAKHERDYRGGLNNYACLTTLSESVQRLLNIA